MKSVIGVMSYPDMGLRSGLEKLKWAFLFYLIGTILGAIPIISIIGAIFAFIALIFLIWGWWTLGGSRLSGANNYRFTAKILIGAIIAVIVVSVVGFISVIFAQISSIVVNPTPGQPPTINQTTFESLIIQFLIVIAIGELIVTLAFLKSALTLKSLSSETSEPKFKTASSLLIAQLIIGFAAFVGLVAFLSAGVLSLPISASTPSSVSSSFFFYGTGFIVFAAVAVAAAVIAAIGYYFGYTGANEALLRVPQYGGPGSYYQAPPPPPWTSGQPSPSPQVSRFCPSCGSPVDYANASFCRNCGAKLSFST